MYLCQQHDKLDVCIPFDVLLMFSSTLITPIAFDVFFELQYAKANITINTSIDEFVCDLSLEPNYNNDRRYGSEISKYKYKITKYMYYYAYVALVNNCRYLLNS